MELCTKNVETNPWMVEELEEFLYFCCPECDGKYRAKDPFLKHAFCHHPNVSFFSNEFKESVFAGVHCIPIFLRMTLLHPRIFGDS